MQLTAVYLKVPQGYVGLVEELPGVNTQGDTLEEARTNLPEAVQLVMEANRFLAEETFVGQDVIREFMPLAASRNDLTLSGILKNVTAYSCEKVAIASFISTE